MIKYIVASVILFATIYGTQAQTGHICDYYSNALGKNNSELMNIIVGDLVTA